MESYLAITKDIHVSVRPSFLADQSRPSDNRFVWAYQINIRNQGKVAVKLLSRYWRITDALGRVQEVRGDGVVGKQPLIAPGAYYQYESGCPLSTPSGIMEGSYRMADADGRHFDVRIPAFSLDTPDRQGFMN